MEQQLSTDLLVIGGGFGGLFAAIQARKLGVRDVLIVDKGAVGLTGQSRMAAGATVFVHPGDDVESWADAVFRGQNGLCNQDMVESFLENSTERLREIESLGVVYRGGAGEKYLRMPSRDRDQNQNKPRCTHHHRCPFSKKRMLCSSSTFGRFTLRAPKCAAFHP